MPKHSDATVLDDAPVSTGSAGTAPLGGVTVPADPVNMRILRAADGLSRLLAEAAVALGKDRCDSTGTFYNWNNRPR